MKFHFNHKCFERKNVQKNFFMFKKVKNQTTSTNIEKSEKICNFYVIHSTEELCESKFYYICEHSYILWAWWASVSIIMVEKKKSDSYLRWGVWSDMNLISLRVHTTRQPHVLICAELVWIFAGFLIETRKHFFCRPRWPNGVMLISCSLGGRNDKVYVEKKIRNMLRFPH